MISNLLKSFKNIIVLVTILSLFHCPKVDYKNPTDGSGGLAMQLMDTLRTSLAEVTSSELRVILTGNPSAISEGQSVLVQIKMSKAISAPLAVRLTLDNSTIAIDGTATKEIIFTPDNATIDQSFSLLAIADNNTISETVNLRITGVGLTDQTYTISTIDTTSPLTFVVTNSPTAITEGGSSIVNVRLSNEVDSDVVATITSSDPAIKIDGASSKTFTFSPKSATLNQSFILAAVSDLNTISETTTVTVSGNGVPNSSFAVSTIDTTSALSLVITNSPSAITEGESSIASVRLSNSIETTISATITSSDPAIKIDGASTKTIIFTPSNATANQNFTLSAISDTNVLSETSTILISGSGIPSFSFAVSTIDTTPALAFVVTNNPSTITEGGISIVNVRLSGGIDSNITATITSSDPAIKIDGASSKSITFTPSNATTNQSFILTAVNDPNSVSETSSISVTGGSAIPANFSVSTLDTTTIADNVAPTFLGVTSATAKSAYSIELIWNAATDDITSQSSILYDVYISTLPGSFSFALASYTSTAGATTYTVTSLTENTTYYFVVRARDAGGNRDSNVVQISAKTKPAPVITRVTVPSVEATGGDIIEISGENFNTTPSNNTIKLRNCILNVETVTGGTVDNPNSATFISAKIPTNSRSCESGRVTVLNVDTGATGTSLDSVTFFLNLMIVTNFDGTVTSYLLDSDYDPVLLETGPDFKDAVISTFTCGQTGSNSVPLVADYTNKLIYAGCSGKINILKLSDTGGFTSLTEATTELISALSMNLSPDKRFLIVGAENALRSYSYLPASNSLLDNNANLIDPLVQFHPSGTVTHAIASRYSSFVFYAKGSNLYRVPLGSSGRVNEGISNFTMDALSLGNIGQSTVMDANERLLYVLNGTNSTVTPYRINSSDGSLTAGSSVSCPGATAPMYGIRSSKGVLYVVGGSRMCLFATNETLGTVSLIGSQPTDLGIMDKTFMFNFDETRLVSLSNYPSFFNYTEIRIDQIASGGNSTVPRTNPLSFSVAPTGGIYYKMYK